MGPKIFTKNNHVANSIPTGHPEKNKKCDTSRVLFTGSIGKYTFNQSYLVKSTVDLLIIARYRDRTLEIVFLA